MNSHTKETREEDLEDGKLPNRHYLMEMKLKFKCQFQLHFLDETMKFLVFYIYRNN